MVVNDSQQRRLSITVTEIVAGYLAGIFAVFTILTHLSQVLKVAFQTYVLIGSILTGLLSIIVALFAYKRLKQVRNRDYKVLWLLLSLGALCSMLALVSHRSDSDDYNYIPNVVYMLDHPTEPMGFEVHYLDGGENCNIVSYSWGVSIPFEYTQGVIAYIFGLDFLSVYYLLTPILTCFLIPFVLFYTLSHFFERQPMVAVMSVIVTIGVVLLLGETHRTFGNFFITRAYQGKTLLLAVGIPFFVGATIHFFKTPSLYYWTLLFAIATAMVGATTSAIVILPSLASVLVVANLFALGLRRQRMLIYPIYFASFWYLALYALFIATQSIADIGVNSPINQGYPITFFGHLGLFVNAQKPVTLFIVGIFSIMAVALTSGEQKRFIIAWIVAALLLYLNPLIAPIIIKYLSSPNIYWRLFYIYPFPLVVGISAGYLIYKLSETTRKTQLTVAILTVLLLVGAHFVPFSTSVFRNRTTFRIPPTYKLPMMLVNTAEEVVSQTPEGTMLAPEGLYGVIPMLSSKHPQISIGAEGVRLWLGNCGLPQMAEIRIAASEFVGGDVSKLPEFQDFIDTEGYIIRSIVMHKESMQVGNVQSLLETHGFINQSTVGDYFVLWRSDD